MMTIPERFRASIRSVVLLCALAGCGGIPVADMVPSAMSGATVSIDRTIHVAPVTGGGVITNKSSTLIAVDNEKFREAQVLALRRSGLFKAVSDATGDVELRAIIVAQDEHRDLGEELTLRVRYDFYDSKSKQLILRDSYQTGTDTKWATTALAENSRNNLDAMLRNLPALWPGLSKPAPLDQVVGPREAGIQKGQRIGFVVRPGKGFLMASPQAFADGRLEKFRSSVFSAFEREVIHMGPRLQLSLINMNAGDVVHTVSDGGTVVSVVATGSKQGFEKVFELVLAADVKEDARGFGGMAWVDLRVWNVSDGRMLWERQSRPMSGGNYRYVDFERLGIDAAQRALSKFVILGATREVAGADPRLK